MPCNLYKFIDNIRTNKNWPNTLKKYRRHISIFAACLIALSTISSSVFSSIIVNASLADTDNEKILLCTGQGFKWVTLAELNDSEGNQPQPNHADQHCPLCTYNHQPIDYLLAYNGINLDTPYFDSKIKLKEITFKLSAIRLITSLQPRAPPFA
jgi:hypothetical protein